MTEFYGDSLFSSLEREDPAPGMLLVAAPNMPAPEFRRSVVLIVERDDAVTIGVDLSSRSDVAVANVLPEWVDVVAKPQALYIGGPVTQEAVMGLAVTRPGVDIDVSPHLSRLANRLVHVNLNAAPEEISENVEGLRLFAGHAGWSPGQLEEEIERGDWYVAPALPSDVIAPGNADLWGDVLRRQAMPLPLFATFPEDVGDN